MITEREIERGKKALRLLKQLVNEPPLDYGMFTNYCGFCHVDMRFGDHEAGCILIKAKRLVEE